MRRSSSPSWRRRSTAARPASARSASGRRCLRARRSSRPSRAPVAPIPPPRRRRGEHFLGTLRLLRYRPLFSGPAVERIPELQFQRPAAEVELAHDDAERRQIASGDAVTIRSNGTSVALRAQVSRSLAAGTVRIADEHAADLHRDVEVVKA